MLTHFFCITKYAIMIPDFTAIASSAITVIFKQVRVRIDRQTYTHRKQIEIHFSTL